MNVVERLERIEARVSRLESLAGLASPRPTSGARARGPVAPAPTVLEQRPSAPVAAEAPALARVPAPSAPAAPPALPRRPDPSSPGRRDRGERDRLPTPRSRDGDRAKASAGDLERFVGV